MKKILIAGGTGFIGYHLSKACLKMNWKVTSVSTKLPKKNRKLKNIKYLICDLTKLDDVRTKLNKNFNFVVNLSGYVNHKNKKKTLRSHLKGAKNLVSYLYEKKNKSLEKFVQMGSSAEYGKLKGSQKETVNCETKSIYGLAKLKTTKYLMSQFEKMNFPVAILRLYQAYGPNQDINRLIPIAIDACKKNKSFNCSDGNQLRDFIYIDDVVTAIIKILKNKKSTGQIYNLGTGKCFTIKSVISNISKYYKGGKPLYGKIKLRKEEPRITFANIKKITKEIKWMPKTSLIIGLKKTLKYNDRKI
tara:strand:- start:1490 stop:2398 length:909 start_codon:yes stop_codon:yes gene_type:complete